MLKWRISAVWLLVAAITSPTAAQESKGAMLGVGDQVPANFSAVDSFGRDVTFKGLLGKEGKGVVLLFTRSADWCQYCKAQMKEWNAHKNDVEAAGYKLAAISYDTPKQLQAFADANKLTYTLLSDTDSNMIKAFGILNDKFDEDSRFYGIPNPAIYVIDADGTIQHVFREEGYQERPSVDEVLAVLSHEPASHTDTE